MQEVLLASFNKNFGTLQTYMLQQFFTIPPEIALHPPPSSTTLHIPTQEEEEELDTELEESYKQKVDQDTQLQNLRETKNNLQQKVDTMVVLRDKLQQLMLEKSIEDVEKEVPGICDTLAALDVKITAVNSHKI